MRGQDGLCDLYMKPITQLAHLDLDIYLVFCSCIFVFCCCVVFYVVACAALLVGSCTMMYVIFVALVVGS